MIFAPSINNDMKTTTQLVMMLSVFGMMAAKANAQIQLPNPGFEQWDTIADYTQPKKWFSLNALTQFGFEATTTITEDAHSGNFAVVLETKSGMSELSGVLSSGPILNSQFEADFSKFKVPFTGKPNSLKLFYKSFPAVNDSSVLSMNLTRWNIALQKTDTVARAVKYFSQNINGFSEAIIEFKYNSPLPPDSMFFIASSSADGFNPTVGSKLILDDLELLYMPTSLNEKNEVSTKMYPNPASDFVTFQFEKQEQYQLTIVDVQGKIWMQKIAEGDLNINLQDMPQGLYFANVMTNNGKFESVQLLIQH